MPTVNVSAQPVQIVAKDDPPGVVYNRDAINPVFWGVTASTANRADASILDPGSGIPVDGTQEIWCATASANTTVTVDYIQGGLDRVLTNVAPLKNLVPLFTTSSPILAGAVTTLPNVVFPLQAEAYEIIVTPSDHYFACDLSVTHFDVNGVKIGTEIITVTNAGRALLSGEILPVAVRGKLLGASITVTVTNAASSWVTAVIDATATTAASITIEFLSQSSYVPLVSRVSLAKGVLGALHIVGVNVAVAAAGNTKLFTFGLRNYTGNAVVTTSTLTATVGFAGNIQLNFYQVGNGSAPLHSIILPAVTLSAPQVSPLIFPGLFCQAFWVPAAGSVVGNINFLAAGTFE